jgi:hypothetical protein
MNYNLILTLSFLLRQLYIAISCPQEVVQSPATTPNKAEVSSSNPPSPSCADMSKKYICCYILLQIVIVHIIANCYYALYTVTDHCAVHNKKLK